MCFGDRMHNANLKVRISRTNVAVTTHALSDVTAFLLAHASSILRSLMSTSMCFSKTSKSIDRVLIHVTCFYPHPV